MKISFDGLRRNIALDFNYLVRDLRNGEKAGQCDHFWYGASIQNLRSSIGCLLSCYDKNQQPDDFNDLSDLELEEL